MLDWGGVLQEIEIDTEHFDLHHSIPVDKDVSFIGYCGYVVHNKWGLCVDTG